MKKCILFLSAISFINVLPAQTSKYFPFPTKHASWLNQRGTYYLGNTDWKNPDYFSLDEKDTIINGLTYSKVMLNKKSYHGALRDANGKVYYIPANTTTDLLVYDFTLKKGDNIEVFSFNWTNTNNTIGLHVSSQCLSVDSINIKGVYRKRINFTGVSWIEGIGNSSGLFTPTAICTCDHDMNRLVCMSDQDTTLFPSFSIGGCEMPIIKGINSVTANTAVELFPNPNNGKFQLKVGNKQWSSLEIADLLGKVIYTLQSANSKVIDIDISSAKPGIYFTRLRDSDGNVSVQKIIKE